MSDIQNEVIGRYQRNIEYLKSHQPTVYNKVVLLETAISEGSYQERYSLEYTNEGYFDVKEITSNSFLYDTNSIEYSNQIINMTTLERTGGIFSAQKYVDFSPEMPDIIDNSKLDFHNALWATIKIIEYHRKHIQPTDVMNSVFKSIFIGTGLGLHILPIINKLSSRVIFITEQDLELFRLSLFTTDYFHIAQDKVLLLSIMSNEAEEKEIFTNFLDTGNNYNLNIKHIPFIKNYHPTLQKLQTIASSQEFITYGYSASLFKMIHSPKYITQEFNFLNISKKIESSYLSEKPLLFIFSGPSASKNIDWIISNKDRFIIVTALSTCRLLNKFDIKPDIVLHIDLSGQRSAELYKEIEPSFFEHSHLIFASSNSENVVNHFKKENIFFIDQDGIFKKDFGHLIAPSVGEYAYALFLILGAQKIYLVGFDQAFEPETLHSHFETYSFPDQGKKDANAFHNIRETIIYVKGNFLDKVPTSPLYKLSIDEFARFSKMFKSEKQHIYNLSNGAYLEGTIPLHVDKCPTNNFEVINQSDTYNEIKNFFHSISSSEFREEDLQTIQDEIFKAKKLLEIITTYEAKKVASSEEFLNNFVQLTIDLSDINRESNSLLSQVYYEYFKIIPSYIFDLFNSTKSCNIQELNNLIVKQLKKIEFTFTDTMKEYIK